VAQVVKCLLCKAWSPKFKPQPAPSPKSS
jgi:hypothetical protein